MNEFAKKDFKEQKIPESPGFFTFSDENKILYTGITTNLKAKINTFLSRNLEDENVFKMISLTRVISYTETETFFNAFVEKKKLFNKEVPEYNRLIRPFENYVYLGIDFSKVPFFRVTQDTQSELYFLGPFKDRFFLYDFLDIMGTLFKFPVCEDENYPCQRYEGKKCSGWCLKENEEITKIIFNSYLQPDIKLINKIQKKYDEYFNELKFEKAESLKNQRKIIEKYYEIVKFLHITKEINLDFTENKKKYKIRNGILVEILENREITYFPELHLNYRDNELLTFEKDQLVERWIIYNHLKKNKLERLNEIYKRSISKINEFFS
ncbi:MAG: hypothetical protein KAW88_00975 [Candidatus Cloacimonetes bacterium]|nr:hypothetical protein [Candidatus Cloacimonadota bacterium]